MKNILRLLAGGFAAVLLALTAQAADSLPAGAFSAGTVKGDVTYKLPGSSEYKKLEAGTSLPQGATIKTGPKSSVAVVFSSGTNSVIDADSEIEVTKFEQAAFTGPVSVDAEPAVSNTEIKIIDGTITSKVAKLKKGSNFTINSPVGAAGVRGTILSVTFKKGNTTISIVVVEGKAVFTKTVNGVAETVTIDAGKGLTMNPDTKAVSVENISAPDAAKVMKFLNDETDGQEDVANSAKTNSETGEPGKKTVTITPVDTSIVEVSTN